MNHLAIDRSIRRWSVLVVFGGDLQEALRFVSGGDGALGKHRLLPRLVADTSESGMMISCRF